MRTGLEIAVIGMAGRFPGAKDIHEFWHNLKNGIETITFFSEKELQETGISPQLLENPQYVKANGMLADIEYFDGSFFGYTPKEAEMMNPQTRIFHECVWTALEDAGYDPGSYDGLIGLYAGATQVVGWEGRALLSGKSREMGAFAARQLTKKDYLTLRISYKLNLMGPSFVLSTACSTSLVAIHLACQSILSGDCDMALAGGVTVSFLDKTGYMYQAGMIFSPNGRCRTFDAGAKGTVGGDGAGVVVLKRLEDALLDRDHIYAVIKGTAINNDGTRKAGFTASSVEGQAEVVKIALRMAEVEPESISYIEAHGTATPLGDPVEIEGLRLAFNTHKKNFCAVGSVKSNFGHLDSAAGAAGFMKTVLALKHRRIPPSLHFEIPNPQIDFINSPFYVNSKLTEWENGKYPLRAGVSSFGIGGTNAHVVLEEAPEGTRGLAPLPAEDAFEGIEGQSQAYQLILLSAKTPTALDSMKENLAGYLKKTPGINLADVAYTLQVGRKACKYRWMAVCSTAAETLESLTSPGAGETNTAAPEQESFRHENPGPAADRHSLTKIGRLWLHGQKIDWKEFYSREKRYRVSLPTYSFERQRYWIGWEVGKNGEEILQESSRLKTKTGISDWFYIPAWKSSVLTRQRKRKAISGSGNHKWLIFVNELNIVKSLVNNLKDSQQDVIVVKMRETFGKIVDDINQYTYTINPGERDHYESLFNEPAIADILPDKIIHCWNVTGENAGVLNREFFDAAQYPGFYSLLYIAKAVGKLDFSHDIQVTVLTDHLQEVIGGELLCPEKSTVLGLLKSIPQEYPGIRCRTIDIHLPEPGSSKEAQLIDALREEFTVNPVDTVIAYRNNHRWVRIFEPLHLEEPPGELPGLKEKGVYLVTGGLGQIGLMFSHLLVKHVRARLILTGRSTFPARDQWDQWLENHEESDPITCKIKKWQAIEEMGGEVLYIRADAADYQQMRDAVTRGQEKFGEINGVIHCAGIIEGESMRTLQELSENDSRRQFQTKVYGVMVLEELFKDREPDFCWMISSISCVLGGLGFGAYAAANQFMDVFVKKHNRLNHPRSHWFSLNWDGMDFNKSVAVFERVFSLERIDQLVVSRGGDLETRIDKWVKLETLNDMKSPGSTVQKGAGFYPRPDLPVSYEAPRNATEEVIANLWQNLLGFDKIGVRDDFLELGGDSLKAITLITRIHRELHVNIPVTEFFSKPTVEGIAEYISADAREDTFLSIEPVEKKEFYQVSSAQKRLFILQQVNENSVRYNIPVAARLAGVVDKDRVKDTFAQLIERHESFRTSFEMMENEPVQKIHQSVDFDIVYYDLANGERISGGQAVEKTIKSFYRSFDLSRAPLLRVGLMKEVENQYILVVEMHHIISDGVSLEILIREFDVLYRGEKLPGLKVRYKEFTVWQNKWFKSEGIKKQEKYWLHRLRGDIPILNVPLDFPKPGILKGDGDIIRFEIGGKMAAKIKQLSLKTKTTLSTVLLAAYNVLLAKYSRQEDIIVGTPVAGRRHTDLENVIGVFVNMIAIRNQPHEEKTFREFLMEVKNNALEAYENQDYQFEELVWNLGIKVKAGKNPLFDAVFVSNNTQLEGPRPGNRDQLNKFEVSRYQLGQEKVQHELILNATEGIDTLYMNLEYSTELFKESTARKISDNFGEILKQILEQEDIKLRDIRLSHDLIAANKKVIRENEISFGF